MNQFYSDEGLKLEASVFKSLYGDQFTLLTLWLIIFYNVSLSHRRTQFVLIPNPLCEWAPGKLHYMCTNKEGGLRDRRDKLF